MINLFRQNFDLAEAPVGDDHPTTASPAATALRDAVERARQEGFDAGCGVGEKRALASAEADSMTRLQTAHTAIHDGIENLVKLEDARQRTCETDIIELFLGIAERVFPELLERYGTDLALEQIRACLDRSRTAPVLRIEGNAVLISELKASMSRWAGPAIDVATIALTEKPELPAGEARVFWESGRLEYDLGQATAGVLEALHSAAAAMTHTSHNKESESA